MIDAFGETEAKEAGMRNGIYGPDAITTCLRERLVLEVEGGLESGPLPSGHRGCQEEETGRVCPAHLE